MRDDTVTTSWKRSTDRVKTSCSETVHDILAATSKTTRRQKSHPDSLGLGGTAASSSSPTHTEPAAADCPTDRNREATRQAARLATCEDEGGTTAFR